jgi:hypothetical protein
VNDLRTQLRDGLVRGIPTFERHRRRRRAAVGGAVATVAVAAGGALVASRAQDDDGVRVDTTAPPTTTAVVPDPTTTTRPTGMQAPLGIEGVAATVVAIPGPELSHVGLVVADLDTGLRTQHLSLGDLTGPYAGAVVTNAGYVVVWQVGARPVVYATDGGSLGSPLAVGRPAGDLQVVPTLAGDEAWLYDGERRRVELVDLATGRTILETDADAAPLGTRGRDLLLPDADRADRVRVLAPGPSSLTFERLEGPSGSTFVAATPDATAWSVDGTLRVERADSSARYGGGEVWPYCAAGATSTPRLPTLTPDGRYLLVGRCDPRANPPLRRLDRIDLIENGHRGIGDPGAVIGATISRDGRYAITVRGTTLIVVDIEANERRELLDAIPAGYVVQSIG